ncbi:RsiV family protein [uncultured Tenacibaculum sp.]|uniref:RsiV family protein n=1 Tax=uncultured Tenacibaculum sp. TaxID=174713 RepID=UPI0026044729|nr:RsiV family protein [uncultured Tenacibaculum sp.]
MRIVSFLIVVLAITSCKLDKEPSHNAAEVRSEDSLIINDTVTIQLNTEELQQNVKINPIKSDEDDSNFIKDYVVHKQLYKETDNYIIDFCYPQLDENYNPKFELFNDFVENELIQLSRIEQDVLESQELLCDTLQKNPIREHRIGEYKIYQQKETHISVLFYLENHYAQTKTAYYTFKTVNFDKIKGKLLHFEDYFLPESLSEVHQILNSEIRTQIAKGDLFYECFEVSLDDFEVAKNDFVVNDNHIIFYFNDCIMCPSFVGTYSIEIPLEKLKPVLQQNWSDRFIL